jgi:hypothetical protein
MEMMPMSVSSRLLKFDSICSHAPHAAGRPCSSFSEP